MLLVLMSPLHLMSVYGLNEWRWVAGGIPDLCCEPQFRPEGGSHDKEGNGERDLGQNWLGSPAR